MLEQYLPDIVVMIGAISLALIVHWLVFALVQKALTRGKAEYFLKQLYRLKSITRLALIVFAAKLSMPWIDMAPELTTSISHIVSLCLIGTIGWFVLILLHALTDATMSRHRIDVEDNLQARKARTRLRVLRQAVSVLIVIITMGSMLMVFPEARTIGVSLFASAGVAGIIIGFAARPVLSNLLAGIQIALTQPIRIDDAVVMEGEWGWIEEITATYVVVKIWDWRRLIVPLSYVIEKPFQNWTRETASIIGNVTWHVDYTVPIDEMRKQLKIFLEASNYWDGDVQVLQVIDSGQQNMTVRALMSAKNSPTAWDLRCEVREKMIHWLQAHYPHSLPKYRAHLQEK